MDDTSKLPKDQQIHASDIPMLYAAGEYWGRYGTHYDEIVSFYNSSDAAVKVQIKALIPDVERMCAAHAVRMRTSITQSTPTGAYISLVARYLPSWKLFGAGKTEQAIKTMLGVMHTEPQYHLQGLPVLEKVLQMRGDSPDKIKSLLVETVGTEQIATQEIGLHFLAVMYEKSRQRNRPERKSLGYNKLAYETWYRARVRNALDFYAKNQHLSLGRQVRLHAAAKNHRRHQEIARARSGRKPAPSRRRRRLSRRSKNTSRAIPVLDIGLRSHQFAQSNVARFSAVLLHWAGSQSEEGKSHGKSL